MRAALRTGHASRREEVAARNSVVRAESALIGEEAREDDEARAAVLAGSSGVRNPERSALAAGRAEARRVEAFARVGMSESSGAQAELESVGQELLGRLQEAYRRVGMDGRAEWLVLGRGHMTEERLARMRRTLEELSVSRGRGGRGRGRR